MPGQTKYFISNTNGFFVNWYSDITGLESHGQALKASGNSGDDAVYVGQGTKVDATGLTSTGGNDSIYLTGTFNNYEQTLDGNTYTFKRTVNINGTEYQEEVSFTASNGDRVYFADGFVKIDITGNDGLLNLNTGAFKRIESTDIDNSESTPGLGIGLRITDDKSDTAKVGEVITYTFTFDEAVTDFDINDITVTGGTKGTFTSVNGSESVYTLELTPPANSKGIINLTVAVDAATSKVNTALKSVAASNNQSFDTQAPTLIISDDKADTLTLKTGDTITYTFTFSEAVTGFDKSVINISNGAIKTGTDLIASTTPADAGKVYTLTVVPSSDLDVGSNLTVSVSANPAITDSAGNAYSTTAANNEQAIDTKAPVAELSGNMAPNENLTMTFLEAVTINTAGSIVIYDKANSDTLITIDIANQVSLDSTNKIITINPGSDLIVNKNYYVKIDAGTFKDTAGNNYEGIDSNSGWGFLVYSFTTTAQWVDASGNSVSDNGINASESSTLAIQGTLTNSGGAAGVVISAITFKAASGTTANDRVVETSNLPTFASADGTEWTLANSKIPALVSGETYTIEINLSSTGGGTSTGGNTTPVLIDTAAPIITSWAVNSPTDGQSGFKVDDVIELTMTTNEALSLSNATSSKVTIGNKEFTLDTGKGAAKAGASVDELKQLFFTYTVKVDDSINKADFEITNESAITLTGVTDVAGNIVATTGTYPVELDRNVDGVVPTIGDITLNWGDILNAIEDNSNGTVTVATTGVENNQEVSLVINQKTYTGTVTSNSATITVAATDLQALTHGQTYSYKVNIKDTAGNPAIEKIGDFKVDTVAPTLTITDNEDATAKAGEEIIFTFTFNEVVTEFTKEDIVITNGTIKGGADLVLVTTGVNANKAYTLVVVPNTDTQGNLEVSVAADKFVDIAGNRNMVAANDIQVIDTLAPNALTATALISAESNDVVVDNTAPILTTQASAELGETSDLILDFNEDIQAGSTGSIVIKGSDDGVIATINITETTKFSIAGDKLTIDVSALGLTDNKLTQGSYYITMDAGTVTDIAGNDAAAITKDTNQWAFETKALFTTIAWIGADDNYINDSEKDATALSGKVTGIGTLTITKIEFFEGSNTVGTAITSGLPAVAADGTWALAHSAMPSELADGKTYTAVVTLSDGTNSAISTSTAVTYDTINPTPITTNPWTLSDIPAGQSAFKTGDVISLTLTMSETLKLNNTTGSKVVIAGKDFVLDKTASTTAGDKKLVFKYSVQAGDSIAATDFDIDNPTSDITLNNITDVAGNAPVFTADRVVLAKTKLEYIEKIGLGNNPFEGIDVGKASAPTLADIDGDGDLDLVVGENDGTLKYYQNTGTTSSPAYEAKTGGNNPFNGINAGFFPKPTLADIDGDGDLDLVVGENDGTLKYYQNTGTTSNPTYEAKTGDSNPFDGIDVRDFSSPSLADIDGDGDLDLVVGEFYGTLKYYQNTGTTSNPAYEVKTGDSNPFNGIDVGYYSTPTLADIDGDGDLDLVVGESAGTLKYYQNTGTTSNPAYEAKTGDSNPFNGIDVGYSAKPTLADIDGDGDLDLVVGKYDGTLKYYYNQQPSSVDGQAPTPTATNSWTLSNIPAGQSAFKAGDVISLTLTMSETLKLNNTTGSKVVIAGKDFVLDKTASTTAGDKKLVFKYSVQAGDSIAATDFDIDNPTSDITLNNITDVAGNAPVFTADRVVLTKLEYIEKIGSGNNPFEGIDVGNASAPTLADIDGDGDLDLVVGEENRTLKYYQNTGTTSNPAYEAKTGGSNPFNGINAGFFPKPTLADIDGDGDLDLVVGENDGTLKYYQNTGTTSNPAYEAKTGDDNPFNGIDVGYYSTPTLADIDGDGDLDLVMGEAYGTLKYYQNTGTTSNPAYEAKTGDDNPFNGIDVGDSSKPTLADIDGDGDLDLVVGESDGTLKYYQNTGTTSNPAYEAKIGDGNPFNGIDVGRYSAPVLADIDGDGDLDLVVGEQNGTLKYYYNQQPSSVDGQAPTLTTQASVILEETSDLVLDFSENIKAGTGSILIKNNSDVTVATINIASDTNKFSIANDKLTIDVSALGLTNNKLTVGSYYLEMNSGAITDMSGNDALGIAKNSNQWAFETTVLTTDIVWAGADDNYINNNEKDATTLSGKATGIGTLTITKIEFFEGSNTVGTAITSGLPAVAADGTWALAHSAMPSELADGKTYTAVVTLSDGTNSAISTSTAVTYDTINPIPITTNPWTLSDIPAGQSAFKAGDVISLTLTMSETLKLNNTTGSKVVIAGKDFVLDKTASTTAGDKKLVFKYSVQAGDSIAATDFDIDNPTSDITLNNITDVAGNAPVFTADRVVLAKLEYIEKIGSGNNPFEGIDVGNVSVPTLADIDGDGDLDLVVGEGNGTLKYYQNTGTTSNPAYEVKTGGSNPFNGIDVGNAASPILVDIDGDGDLDLVVGEKNGTLKYYQNTGTTSNPAYEAKTGDDNPFNGIDVGYYSTPTLADIDGDGDLDLVMGEVYGTLKYYQNTGTTSNPAYEAKTGDDNPFNGIDVGLYSTPTLADIDGDGDLDLVVGEVYGTLKYYQNTGTTSNPAYEAKTGGSNPFNGIDVGEFFAPTLADIDGDGDLDLVVGKNDGTLKYYYNQQPSSVDGQAPTLTTQASVILEETSDLVLDFSENIKAGTGSILIKNSSDVTVATINIASDTNKFSITNDKLTIDVSALGLTNNKLTVGSYYLEMNSGAITDMSGNDALGIAKNSNQWAFKTTVLTTDIVWAGADDNYINNNEKDATTLSGKATGIGTLTITKIEFFEGSNTVGTAITSGLPVVAADGTWALAHSAMPSELVDGKTYTAVVTLSDGTNSAISTSTAVTYDTINPTPITTNPWTLSDIPAGQSAFKVGDVISLTLTMSETLKLNNTTGSKVVIAGKDFVLDKTASTTAGDKKLVFKYSVQAGDSIAATDFDIDNPTSDITLNNITDVAGNAPVFTADRVVLTKLEYIEKTGSGNNPFEGIDVGNASAPTLADIDGDGDLDLVVGEGNGTLKYYQNTGTTSNPAYEVKTGGSNPFNGIDVGNAASPILVDIDGDGDLDLVVGERNGTLKYYQNTGTTSNPAYEAKTGDDNPFNGIDVGYYSTPTLADIDGDGDLDLVMGEVYGTLKYYQNTGTTSNPAYEAKTGDDNPFNGIDVGLYSTPTLADIDGDGDLDLVVGEVYGTLKYYQNTGTTSNPAYEAKTGDSNPFNGIDVGEFFAPTLADIDGDGDLDLVVGKNDGTLKYYYNQQPSSVDGQAPTLTTQASVILEETSDLVLDFSENIKAGTGSILIKNSSDVTVATINIASDTNKFSITNDKLTIDVSALGLTNNKLTVGSYYLEMNSGAITDMSGNDALGIAKNSNQWAFKTTVLTTDIVWAGADDNYINNNEKDATTLSGKATGIGTLTITKIEFFEGSNTVGTAITSGLPVVAADGTWALAHSAMPSELADGKTYTAVVTLSDGTNSAISTSTAVTYDTINPTPITTNPWTLSDIPAGQSAFKVGDVISLTLTMSETLKLNNTTGSKVVIAGKDFVLDKTASTTAGDKKLVFKYSVQAGDSIAATDFDIDNPTSDITLNNITDVAGNAPVFTADRVVLAKAKLEYIEKTGSGNNPFEGIDVGYVSVPILADIDGDGDLDLVVGENDGTLKYYQNTGTTSNPAYEAKTGDDNPFNSINVGIYSGPTLADIDGDGDLDLVMGEAYGTLKYYQNTGTTSNPAYEVKTGGSNPFNSIDVGDFSKPTLADIDGDGDLDLVVGEKYGTLKYYQNTGTTSNPAYEAKTGGSNPFNSIDVGDFATPTLADIDGDGDLDLVVGEYYGTLKYYQNTGTTSNPAYEVKTGGSNPFNSIDVGDFSKPTLADIDGDGDLDLVVGENNGTLKYYYNQQSFFVDGQAPTLTTQASVILEETSDLVLDFSENIKAGTGSILIKNNSDVTVATINIASDTNKFSITNDKLTIDVSALGLTNNKLTVGSYYLEMNPGAVTDMSGNDALGIAKDTNQWAFEIIVLTTDIVWAGADDNYINNNEKDATTLSGTVAGAGTLSITKIEFFEGSNSVATVSSLPTIADDKTWTLAHANMPSELADGKTYTAVVTLSDGTNSAISTSTAVTYDTINPTPITTNPWTLSDIPAGQSAFKTGDVISLTLTMSETLKLNNTTGSKVVIVGKDFVLDKTASTTAGDKKLVFKYSVQAGDSIAATDFDIDNPTRDITLNNITDVAGNAPVFTADRVVLAKLGYIEKIGLGNNPFNGIDVGNASAPTLADIDGDGDLDLVVGEENHTLKYYQNTGTTSNPAYEAKTGGSNPFNGINAGFFPKPTLADIDGDGDLDLVVGENDGTLKYYQNTGTTSNPAYEAKTGDDNPFNGIYAGYSSSPILVDIDGDGDLDLVMGEAYGTLKYYQNTGTTSNPAYEVKTGGSNPFNSIDVGDSSKPTLADIDGDGDLDLVVGESDGTLKYYQNTGTTSNPAYEAKIGDDNPFNGIDVGRYSAPVLADIDGDGDLDLVVGEQNGTLKYYYNQQPSSVDGQAPTLTTQASVTLGETSDLVLDFSENIKAGTGSILIKNSSDVTVATINIASDTNKFSITNDKLTIDVSALGLTNNKLTVGSYYLEMNSGAITDMSGNDALGIAKNSNQWAFKTIVLTTDIVWAGADDNYINNNEKDATTLSGTVAGAGTLSITKIEFFEGSNSVATVSSLPTIADDKTWTLAHANMPSELADGKTYTAVVTLSDGTNSTISTSTAVTYDIINPTPITTNPWTLSNIPAGQSAFKVGDVISLTLTMSETLKLNNTTGSKVVIAGKDFVLDKTASTTAGDKKLVFKYSVQAGDSIAATDFDIDNPTSDITLNNITDVAGNAPVFTADRVVLAKFEYIEKTGLGNNPFEGIDVGDRSKPTLADIDGDGDLDLVVGENNGTLKYYQNTGTTSNPAYEAKTGDSNPFNGIDVGNAASPTLADIDGDGDLDLVVGENYGTLKYYQNTGTTSNPAYEAKTGDDNPFNGIDVGYVSVPNLADIDGDGDLDLVVGENDGTLKYFQNTGTTSSPAYEVKTGDDNPFNGIDVGDYSKPTLADIDGDGDLDLMVGKNDGTLKYYQNTGTTSNPAYEAKTGGDNPFNGIKMGYSSSPTLADIDGDGDLDLVVGKDDGTLKYYYNQQSFFVDTQAPTPITTNPWTLSDIPAGQSAFKTGDVISLTLTMSETLKLNNTTGSKVVIAGKDFVLDKTASTTAGDKKLVFKYSVQAGDSIAATDFDIDNPTSDITLNNITDVAGNAPVFTADRVVLAKTKLEYIEKTGSGNNPFEGIDVGNASAPTLADIDGDGDLDLVVGEKNGTLKYYQNTGTTSSPAYEAKTGGNNPFNGIDVGGYSSPTLADIDGDGNLDLVVGERDGTLKYYQNTGTTSNPAYEAKTGDDNPFNGIDVGHYSTPNLADIDGDGDLDLVVGEVYGTLKYYQNTSSTSNPAYEAKTGDDNPFNGIDVGYSSKPTLADIDGDGDLDLVMGEAYGTLKYYQNTGTTSNPAYEAKIGDDNPFNGIDVGDYSSPVGDYSSPVLADIDGDGDLDLVVGEQNGTLKYYYNQQPSSVDTQAPTPITTNPWTLSDIPAGQSAFKTGDVISLTLTMSETLKLNNTTDSKVVIAGKDFVLDKTASTTAGDKKLVFKYSVQAGDSIAATDFDIDNPTSDITLNNITDVAGNAPVFTADRVVLAKTKLEYIEKIGSGNNPFEGIDVGNVSVPILADIDGDGDLDLVVGEGNGTLKYYQNTGTTSSPAYEAKTVGSNPFNGIDVVFFPKPTLADIDGDGDLDLVVGENDGTLKYYQNTGTTSNPAYEAKTGDSNPFNGIDAGYSSSPILVDIDGDGDLDLVVGENNGTLKYYQNKGTTSNPAYEAKTGDSNPFNGIDAGYSSSPILADIDGDGDLDLVVGEFNGTLKHYQNTGTTSNPAYEVKTGGSNPFNSIDVGRYSAPVLADIDGDGDLDLVVGGQSGKLKYYYNQQPSSVDGQVPTFTEKTSDTNVLGEPSNLVIEFSENIKTNGGIVEIWNSAEKVATISITNANISDTTLTLNPNSLTSGVYYIKMASGVITDTSGNDFAGIDNTSGKTWAFAYNFYIGTDNADTITGSAGDDTINGGAGNDTINGGSGSDIFVYANTDNGEDTITGFIFGAGGDKLDLKDFITASGNQATLFANIDKYITVSDTGTAGSAKLTIDADGTVTDDVADLVINLQGVSGIGGSSTPDTVALGHFITDNLILV
ncbi:FG-GAP-like repeat-containing protein [Candidatus Thiodubiliella endoseptemdiera]|uniref:FG-GAP-like repeat-containing protein n=3 Tax=Gammaproteobacteria TaxID=1236 RepID=UPI0034DE2525